MLNADSYLQNCSTLHYYIRFTALQTVWDYPGELVSKPVWILLKQETVWQWHQLGHMQICTSSQTDYHASTSNPPVSFLQARCPSCHPTNSVKALKGNTYRIVVQYFLKQQHLYPTLSHSPHICKSQDRRFDKSELK